MTNNFYICDCFNEDENYWQNSALPDFRYEEIKNTVSSLVSKFHISDIPLDVFQLGKLLDIKFVKYSKLTEYEKAKLEKYGISQNSDGFFAIADKNRNYVPYIYYNDKKKS